MKKDTTTKSFREGVKYTKNIQKVGEEFGQSSLDSGHTTTRRVAKSTETSVRANVNGTQKFINDLIGIKTPKKKKTKKQR